jgi:hypothetical protein
MVIVKLISGLGNQLFQYVLGRQLAIANNVPLKLDTSFYETQSLRDYKLGCYNIAAQIASKADIENILKKHHPIAKIQRYFLGYNKYHYQQKNPWYYDPRLADKIKNGIYLDGYWQSHRYYTNINDNLLYEVTLAEAEASEYNLYSIIRQDEQSVSIHIRRGDYMTDSEANKMMGVLPLAYYHQAVAYIRKHVSNPRFYIFSDDLNWAADNLKPEGPVILMDIANGKKDYIELDMMSKCRHNIIANSTFSWWAAFTNRNPGKIVIGPKNWVTVPQINAEIDLLFPEWIKM